ncbi:unnamed protein product, partial [Sphacelaria rigidula]
TSSTEAQVSLSSAATMTDTTSDDPVGGASAATAAVSPLPDFLRQSFMRARTDLPTAISTATTTAGHDGDARTALIHVYVGNEACDADSICSAICLAFLNGAATSPTAGGASTALEIRERDGGGEQSTVLHIPVIPIPRADLALRREVLVLFELCGVDPAWLTFVDEVDLSVLQVKKK